MRLLIVFLFLNTLLLNNCLFGQNTYPATSNKIKYVGRVAEVSNNSISLSWTGCTAIIRFRGTRISANVSGINHKLVFYVDGEKQNELTVLSANNQTITIANNLSNSEHELIIKRVSLVNVVLLILHNITVDGELLDIPQIPERKKIEFFGNSVSEGYASGAQDALQADDFALSDHSKAYTSLLADSLNAEYHNTSISGIAVCQGAGPFTAGMETRYDKLYPLDSARIWDFKKFIPDLCVMALGVNDYLKPVTGMNWTTWKERYKQLIINLRNQYGSDTQFLFAVAPMIGSQTAPVISIKMLVAELNALGIKASYYVYSFITAKHPIEFEQKKMASELFNYIKLNNILTTDISQLSNTESSIYYDSTNKCLELKDNNCFNQSILIYTHQGKLVKKIKLNNGKANVIGVESGVYILKWRNGKQLMAQKMILK